MVTTPEARRLEDQPLGEPGIDLYWIPLGAGGQAVVRASGRVYEAIVARLAGRRPLELYHAALEVHTGGARYTIELTPVPREDGTDRGVVNGGAVGSRALGRLRWFRYELRCWPDGAIPDVEHAVGGRRRLTNDPKLAHTLLATTRQVPGLTWGRDECRTGEMWNSNSVVSWLLATSEVPLARTAPPAGGRAPGWGAGLAVARTSATASSDRGHGRWGEGVAARGLEDAR